MQRERFEVSFWVRVFDGQRLYEDAMHRAVGGADAMCESDARDQLAPDGVIDLGACLVMILDPGDVSHGVNIEECSVERGADAQQDWVAENSLN
ncbi:hypothetical protein [Paraburkholderia tropica]|uniref:hypothetical protein n=1 Tax=Paraburkholderia tropica TaxID=92647 RepID=UPI002AB7C2D5|nr:hypothetical protein [Paraburkholderia tropica]